MNGTGSDNFFARSLLKSWMLIFLGAAAGWLARSRMQRPEAASPASGANATRPRPAAVRPPPGATSPIAITSAARGKIPEGLKAFLALRRDCLPNINVQIFSGQKVTGEFAKLFALSADDVARLNASLEQAGRRVEKAAISAASVRTDPAGHRYIVQVAPFPGRGGAIRAGLIQTFQDALGPERYRAFQSLGGDQFESLFDQFGLAETTYRIDLVPVATDANSDGVYKVTATHAFPVSMTNTSANSSTGNFTAGQLSKYYPVLAHYIPAGALK